MTIEHTLERIAQSSERMERLLEQLLGQKAEQPALPLPTPAPAPVPTPAAAVPPAPPAPFPVPPVPAAGPACPLTDAQSVTAYAMEKWRTLGPVKGGMIQQVLSELGCTTIQQLTADKYAAFWQKVEAL